MTTFWCGEPRSRAVSWGAGRGRLKWDSAGRGAGRLEAGGQGTASGGELNLAAPRRQSPGDMKPACLSFIESKQDSMST